MSEASPRAVRLNRLFRELRDRYPVPEGSSTLLTRASQKWLFSLIGEDKLEHADQRRYYERNVAIHSRVGEFLHREVLAAIPKTDAERELLKAVTTAHPSEAFDSKAVFEQACEAGLTKKRGVNLIDACRSVLKEYVAIAYASDRERMDHYVRRPIERHVERFTELRKEFAKK